jgi:tRNA1(Val) A37 N6-methylase TrmN6
MDADREALTELREGEQLDDLQLKGLKIIQKKGAFRYGTDAVLLANFAAERISGDGRLRKRLAAKTPARPVRILDVGSGTGIVPILMCGKIEAGPGNIEYTGIELFEDMCELSRRSILINGQEGLVDIVCGDVCDSGLAPSSFDALTINPPYVRRRSGIISEGSEVAHARHEILRTQEEMMISGARLLKDLGLFFMVNRPDRLADALAAIRQCGVEPVELRMVHAFVDAAPVMFLCSGRKGGGRGLKVLPPLILGGR